MTSRDPRDSEIESKSAASSGSELRLRAYRIPQVCEISGLGRTSIYAAIKSGDLVARKWNRCTIVLDDDLVTFLNNLPKVG